MSYKFNPFTGTLDDVGPNNGNGVPGGSNTQVQFNDGGVFGGDVDFTWNKTTNLLTIGGDINLNDGGSFTTTLQTITPTANRTISLPDASGTLALVAGSSGQVLYNNAGANAGVSTMTFDGTSITLAGRMINSYTSLASSPAKTFTGTWFTGGTATTTKPHFLIEPTGTTSTAWSTSGTGLGVNAASGFAGNLLDLQVNGTRQVSISFDRKLTTGSGDFTILAAGNEKLNFPVNGSLVSGVNVGIHLRSGSTSSAFLSPVADGVLALGNWNGDNFNRLQFGGTSSSFPALKRNATALQARLADDSAYTTIDAQLRAQGTAPASSSATGTAGDIRYDADYIYVCTATNTWKRAALATW